MTMQAIAHEQSDLSKQSKQSKQPEQLLTATKSDSGRQSRKERIEQISKRCVDRLLESLMLQSGDHVLSNANDRTHILKNSMEDGQASTPTINQLFDIASTSNRLLLFRIENLSESLHVIVDPDRCTVSQLMRTISDWAPSMASIAEEQKFIDENPIPGHEDDADPDADDDGDYGHDGEDDEEDDDRSEEDSDEYLDLYHAGREEQPEQDDNAWKLERLIAQIDRADLRLSISPVERANIEEFGAKKIWYVAISPARTLSEMRKIYSWWTEKVERISNLS